MKPLLLGLILIALAGCTTFGSGDGLSSEQAVVIKAPMGTESGIAAEKSWIRKHYPGSKITKQALRNSDGKIYDVISIVTSDGSSKDIYFDITDFFGK